LIYIHGSKRWKRLYNFDSFASSKLSIFHLFLCLYLLYFSTLSQNNCPVAYFCFIKILLDIKDNKGLHLLEILKGTPNVRTHILTDAKASALEKVREAVERLKMVLKGKKEVRNAENFLNEL